jgi:NAD(P)H-dependent FMN reductase
MILNQLTFLLTKPPYFAREIKGRIAEADGVVLCTPVYHGSYSSGIKCVLDHCGFEEFEDTTVALAAVSGGAFPTSALNQLRIVSRSLNAWVIPKTSCHPERL